MEDRKRTQLDSLRDNISTAPAGVSPRVDRKIVSASPHQQTRGENRTRQMEGRERGWRDDRVCAHA
jgi:hypothetical protein